MKLFQGFTMAMFVAVALSQTDVVGELQKWIDQLGQSADSALVPVVNNVQALQTLLTAIRNNASQITFEQIQNLTDTLNNTQSTIRRLANTTLTAAQTQALNNLNNTLSGVTGFVGTSLQNAQNNLNGQVTTAIGNIGTAVQGVTGTITDVVRSAQNRQIVRQMIDELQAILPIVEQRAGGQALANATRNLIGTLAPIANNTAEINSALLSQIQNNYASFRGAVLDAPATVQTPISGALRNIDALTPGFNNAISSISGRPSEIVTRLFALIPRLPPVPQVEPLICQFFRIC